MKRMSSQPVLVEGLSLLGTRSRNRRVYPQQVMQEAGIVFQPYVAGLFDQVWTPEERLKWEEEWRKRWKDEHINDIRHSGDFWEL